jgi:hypothetical protein
VNLPAGVSQTQIDREHGFANGSRDSNSEECFLCKRQIEQDDDTREWFPADLYYKPTSSDSSIRSRRSRDGFARPLAGTTA